MIATPRFVFLHLHKSGGTFVNECLLRFVPGARQVGYHMPLSAVPPEFAALPALAFVRNPWSYYVSWYSFQASMPQPNALFRALSEDGRLGFLGTIRNMVTLESTPALLDDVVASLPSTYTQRGLNLPGFALAPIRASKLGFYSFLCRYMFEGGRPPHVGRMESLRQDLPRMLEAVGEPVGEEFRRHVESAAPSNTSRHGAYWEYYDEPLRDLVAQQDAMVIRQFNYRFGE